MMLVMVTLTPTQQSLLYANISSKLIYPILTVALLDNYYYYIWFFR